MLASFIAGALLLLPLQVAANKRGLAWPWNNDHSATVFEGHPNSPSWLYDWELYKVGNVDATSLEYVSMARTKDAGPNVSPFMADTGSKRLLCLNEPDMDEQADLTVAQAVSFYKKYCNPQSKKGIKVIAPAVTNGEGAQQGFNYLDQFLAKCTGCHIDAIALHWYGDTVQHLKDHVNDAIARYPGKKIWLTEFAPNVPSVKFLNQAMTFLDKTPEVVRYAYFGAFEGSLMTESGGLSSLGKAYVA